MKNKIVLIAFFSSILIISKEALSVLPNVEVVTLLLLAYTYVLDTKITLYITIIFTIVQALIYPPHMWIITYLIIWPLLVLGAHILKKQNASIVIIAIYAAIFGLSFGLVDSLVNIILFGPNIFFPMWIRGIPFDIIHAVSNYLTVIILFKPLYSNLNKIINQKGS